MSVLPCDRQGCENIMCDHYSDEFGYICRECLSELYNLQPTTKNSIYYFMDSHKKKGEPVFELDIYSIFTMRK